MATTKKSPAKKKTTTTKPKPVVVEEVEQHPKYPTERLQSLYEKYYSLYFNSKTSPFRGDKQAAMEQAKEQMKSY